MKNQYEVVKISQDQEDSSQGRANIVDEDGEDVKKLVTLFAWSVSKAGM